MFQAIAVHHAAPDHIDDFIAFMRRVIAATEGAPGLVEFTAWHDSEQPGRLMGLSRWESEQAFIEAMPRIMSLAPERREEWSAAPDELFTMMEV
jgi:quinol monooxygenase YgiN